MPQRTVAPCSRTAPLACRDSRFGSLRPIRAAKEAEHRVWVCLCLRVKSFAAKRAAPIGGNSMSRVALWIKVAHQLDYARLHGAAERRSGAQSLLQVRHRFLVGSGRPSVLMLIRRAAALATMGPVLLLRVLRKAARRYWNRGVFGCGGRTLFCMRERWVLLKIPRCDIDGAGEGK